LSVGLTVVVRALGLPTPAENVDDV
jgi:hypothetical protein